MATNTSADINGKVTAFAEEYMRKTGKRPPGHFEGNRYIIEIKTMPEEIAGKWKRLLVNIVERYVKDAHNQIQETKQRMGMPEAMGSLLILNPSNTYFNDPKSFESLLVEILRKKNGAGEMRFPHINGSIYFSANSVKTPQQDMYFWIQIQMKRGTSNCHAEIERFHSDLQQGWYRYIEVSQGVKIRQH